MPVSPLGTELPPGDAPGAKPFGPIDPPGTVPSEVVALSGGMAVVMPACANSEFVVPLIPAFPAPGTLAASPWVSSVPHAVALALGRQRAERSGQWGSVLISTELSYGIRTGNSVPRRSNHREIVKKITTAIVIAAEGSESTRDCEI